MAALGYFGRELGLADDAALRGAVAATCTRHGTGTAARTRATASPAPAPTWRARCAATRTCACWSRAAATTSARRISRERLVAGPARRAARRAGARRAPLLRRRAHDVHARGRPDEAEGRPRGLAGEVAGRPAGEVGRARRSRRGRARLSGAGRVVCPHSLRFRPGVHFHRVAGQTARRSPQIHPGVRLCRCSVQAPMPVSGCIDKVDRMSSISS